VGTRGEHPLDQHAGDAGLRAGELRALVAERGLRPREPARPKLALRGFEEHVATLPPAVDPFEPGAPAVVPVQVVRDEAVDDELDVVVLSEQRLDGEQGLAGPPAVHPGVDHLVVGECPGEPSREGLVVLDTVSEGEAAPDEDELRKIVASGRDAMALGVRRVADVVGEPLRLATARPGPVAPAEPVVVLPDPHRRVAEEGQPRLPRGLDGAVPQGLADAARQQQGEEIGKSQPPNDAHGSSAETGVPRTRLASADLRPELRTPPGQQDQRDEQPRC
jgi:hypothetical protein